MSLEIAKLATILRRLGHDCCYCAGELDDSFQPGLLAPEMHFAHPEALWIHDHCFGVTDPGPQPRPGLGAGALRRHLRA